MQNVQSYSNSHGLGHEKKVRTHVHRVQGMRPYERVLVFLYYLRKMIRPHIREASVQTKARLLGPIIHPVTVMLFEIFYHQ
jgi:hypothetical protein